jgi:hypothetical protein
MKHKPTYEHFDHRGSVKYKLERAKRKRARELAEKLLGRNYFTNAQALVLESAIQLSKKRDNV